MIRNMPVFRGLIQENRLVDTRNQGMGAVKLSAESADIVLGDGGVEVTWGPKAKGTQVVVGNFAPGADDKKLKLPVRRNHP